ncbi:MAG: peptidylprolyl isomerase [Chthoniobacteraceae bacterium]
MKSKGTLTLTIVASLFAAEFLIGADAAKKPGAAAPAPAAAAKPADSLPKVVAVVEGTDITKTELEQTLAAFMAQRGREGGAVSEKEKPALYRMVLDDLIVDRLISKRSAELKIGDADVDKEIETIKKNFPSEEEFTTQLAKSGQTPERLRESIRTNLRQRRWVDEELKGKDEVTDAEAEEYYKANTKQFESPEKVRASHILVAVPMDAAPEVVVEKETIAKGLLERVKKGEDFAKLAVEKSEDPSAKQNSGDLDFFAKDQMVPEFADAAFKMKQDEVSAEPVRSQFGYHLIKNTGHKDAETMALDAVKPQLMTYLKNQKKQQEIVKVVKAMREKADVKINLPDVAPVSATTEPVTAPPAPPVPGK